MTESSEIGRSRRTHPSAEGPIRSRPRSRPPPRAGGGPEETQQADRSQKGNQGNDQQTDEGDIRHQHLAVTEKVS